MARPRIQKLTPNQQAWKKEINRIKRFQREAEKRGFHFTSDSIPEQPKRITKQALKRLQDYGPAEQYKKAIYVDPLTGKTMTGTEGRYAERSRASKLGHARRKHRIYQKQQRQERQVSPDIKPLTTSRVTSLKRRIDELPTKLYSRGQEFDFTPDKTELSSIFDDTYNELSSYEGGLDYFEEYIINHDYEFQECLDAISASSDDTVVRSAYAKLATLVNIQRPVSLNRLINLENDLSDYYDTEN